MRTQIFFSLCLTFVVLFLLTCKKDDSPGDIPRVVAVSVSNINTGGADFGSSFGQPGAEPIIDHGFVYGTAQMPTMSNADAISLGTNSGHGSFSARADHAMETGMAYYVSAFAKTEKHITYSDPVSFKSLGSAAPAITAIVPTKAVAGDTITIRGRNFSRLPINNTVRFDSQSADVFSAADTALTVRVPSSKGMVTVEISVKTAGQTVTDRRFSYLQPEIIDFWPRTGIYLDTIYIKEKNYSRKPNDATILFGNESASIISVRDSVFKIAVPSSKGTEKVRISFQADDFTYTATESFDYQIPVIRKIEPTEGIKGDVVRIKGTKFGYLSSKAKIMFGGTEAFMLEASDTIISVIAPMTGAGIENATVMALVDGYTATGGQKFRYQKPIVTSFEPQNACGGDSITIKGQYFLSTEKLSVSFGPYVVEKFGKTTDTEIKAVVPFSKGAEEAVISVKNNGLVGNSTGKFRYLKPELIDFNPKKGSGSDELTIEGQYFGKSVDNFTVYFGNEKAEISSFETSRVKVYIPRYADSESVDLRIIRDGIQVVSPIKFQYPYPIINDFNPKTGTVGDEITIDGGYFGKTAKDLYAYIGETYTNSFSVQTDNQIRFTIPSYKGVKRVVVKVMREGMVTTAAFPFEYLSPEITDFSPQSGRAGDEITICGKNFSTNSNYIKVSMDDTSVPVLSCTKDRLVVKLPSGIVSGSHSFKVSVDNLAHTSSLTFQYSGPWIRKTSIPGEARIFPFAYSHNGEGYAGMGQTSSQTEFGDCWKYNPGNDSWILIKNESDKKRYSSTFFQIGDKIHLGGGMINNNSFNDFYVSDAGNIDWVKKETPPHPTMSGTASFVIDGKAYVCGGAFGNSVWQYDPSTEKWSRKADLPEGNRYWSFSFELNGKGYFGCGKVNANTYVQDLWEYDPGQNRWIKVLDEFPGGFTAGAVCFKLNGKIYAGLGQALENAWSDLKSVRDIWEFDPVKVSWKYATTIPGTGGLGAYVFVIGNKAYIGGRNTSGLGYFYEFDPSK